MSEKFYMVYFVEVWLHYVQPRWGKTLGADLRTAFYLHAFKRNAASNIVCHKSSFFLVLVWTEIVPNRWTRRASPFVATITAHLRPISQSAVAKGQLSFSITGQTLLAILRKTECNACSIFFTQFSLLKKCIITAAITSFHFLHSY